jgi:DNA (cytosine-5)-methyltransferase 1
MLSCVDLFAGAGGFSLAAKEAGLQLKLAIEANRHATETYRANLCTGRNPPRIYEDDITSLSPKKVYSEIFKSTEHCDLLLGGPPCQGFSTHRINDSGVKDSRNSLIHTYFEFVRIFSPSVFLMENVPGMLWSRHAFYVKKFYSEGAKAGYKVFEPIVLDARDFGVPQRRKRVFILGVRKEIASEDIAWPPEPTHGNDAARRINSSLKPWRDCISVFADAPVGDTNDIHMNHSPELVQAFRC